LRGICKQRFDWLGGRDSWDVERNADSVKKVRLKVAGKEGKEEFFYLISLIEHKTQVEYNTCMQIMRYIFYIWEDYEKEMEKKQPGISKRNGFRYPPVLPIVYYEGTKEWTAPRDLKSRINKSELFGEYIPDFKYYLVPIQKYSNEDLLSKKDEISLIMMINKMRTLDDIRIFHELPEDSIDGILKDSPKHIVDIIADILIAFQLKANVPLEEAEANVGKVREKKVARLFEFADLGDVQAMRRKRAELEQEVEEKSQELEDRNKELEDRNKELEDRNKELEDRNKELEDRKKELEDSKKELEDSKKELEDSKKELKEKEKTIQKQSEYAIEVFVQAMKDCGISVDIVREQLRNKYALDLDEAEEKLIKYWN